ncbi:MAG: glycoside hydrolase family 3 C-terminal domain-containing protein [Bacteroidales bacterium]|nr:glycoside hydrolase family 3 C-terminal domain-containing protein [Bacteroidales bacterium]
MKSNMNWMIIVTTIIFSLIFRISTAQNYQTGVSHGQPDFSWPEGKKMALSLSFDDARLSQVDNGIPLFDKYGVKATFYVSPSNMAQRLDGWKKAVSNGHDIGNHTLVHPCTVNYGWPQDRALENYSLQKMKTELDSASTIIENLLGIHPVSFAYPCGQSFVGKGINTKSYVPIVASMFETGRGWLNERPNNPVYCEMSQLNGMELDGKSFDQIKILIESAAKSGQWLILAGHEINNGGSQTSLISTIEAICQYASDPANGIWIDNVHNIAAYVKKKRGETPYSVIPAYKNPLFPTDYRINDLLSRMTLEEKVGQMNIPTCYSTELGWGLNSKAPYLWDMKDTREVRDKQLEGCRKWAEGTHNSVFGPGGGFFTLSDRLIYEGPERQAEVLNELQKIAIEKTRLGIPLLQIEEGTHGLMCPGGTVFPEGLAIGATWNKNLVKRIYTAAAKEGRAIGVHGLCTLVIEPNRDPRLGRNEEGFSEDPYLCSQIAANIVQALQGYDISAPDKLVAFLCHYPGQSQPVSGFERGAMEISERKLREVFLPSFATGIKKYGALGVMATYPAIDGEAVHSSEKILTKILREELGFKGIVLSEGGGLGTIVTERHAATHKEAGILAIKAGVDVGISIEDAYMGGLIENVKDGIIPVKYVDQAVARILRLKFQLGLFENPYVNVEHAVLTVNAKENKELALQTEREAIVLLKNEKNILPLKKNIKSIAVIGPDADARIDQLGDYFPHNIPQEVVTVLQGIKNEVPAKTKITYVKGCDVIGNKLNEIEKAKIAAKSSDIAIVVIGEGGYVTNGEGRDVASLDLTGLQEELLKAVYATGTPTIVVLINGRPLSIRWAAENIPAIVEAWMCGEQGGNAVADVLFGDYNPSGKLPVTVPRHSGQYPFYYNHSATKADKKYIDMPGTPLYEFGYGLSYTTFEYSNLQINSKEIGGEVEISLDVKNTGGLKGEEVVQLYIRDIISSTSKPVKELKGYEKVAIEPGEKKTVKLKLLPEDLSLFDRDMNFVVEPGIFEVMVGSSSEDIRLRGEFEVKK